MSIKRIEISGTYRAQVRRAGYKPISKNFKVKVDAEKWIREIKEKQDQGFEFNNKEAKSTKVSELFIRFRDEVTPTRKSAHGERNAINRILKSEFVHRRLNQIKQDDINDWKNKRLKEIQPQSVGREMTTISKVFDYARKEWQMPFLRNPVKDCSRPSSSGKGREQRWEEEHIEKFLKACDWDETKAPKTSYDHIPWAFLIAIETAMRTGELAKLKVEDCFLDKKYLLLKDTKNGDDRKAPLSNKALAYMRFLIKGKKPKDKVFNSSAGTIGAYFRDIRKKAKLSPDDGFDLHFHDTRHEATTRLAEKLTNVLELGAVTGHRDFKSLQRYYNPNPTDLANKIA